MGLNVQAFVLSKPYDDGCDPTDEIGPPLTAMFPLPAASGGGPGYYIRTGDNQQTIMALGACCPYTSASDSDSAARAPVRAPASALDGADAAVVADATPVPQAVAPRTATVSAEPDSSVATGHVASGASSGDAGTADVRTANAWGCDPRRSAKEHGKTLGRKAGMVGEAVY